MVIMARMARTQVHTKTTKEKTEIKTLKIRKDVGTNLIRSRMVKNLRMILHPNKSKMVGPENSQILTKFEVTLEDKIKVIISILLRTTRTTILLRTTRITILLRTTSNRTRGQKSKINSQKCTLVPYRNNISMLTRTE